MQCAAGDLCGRKGSEEPELPRAADVTPPHVGNVVGVVRRERGQARDSPPVLRPESVSLFLALPMSAVQILIGWQLPKMSRA